MLGPIAPIRAPGSVFRDRSTAGDGAGKDTADPVVTVTVSVAAAPSPKQPTPSADMHIIAQEARVRGLRGGQQVLDAARSAYLGAAFSGPNDRRTHTGQINKTEI